MEVTKPNTTFWSTLGWVIQAAVCKADLYLRIIRATREVVEYRSVMTESEAFNAYG